MEEGSLKEETLNRSVERILNVIVELREQKAKLPDAICQEELLESACRCIVEGAVLLKNENSVLPIKADQRVAFYGKRSWDMMECGSGSTMVETKLHSNVYDSFAEVVGEDQVCYERMESADVLVYTAAAPAGENADREEMDIETEDRNRLPEILREAKEKGIKTVVLLNIAGPVDMRNWIDYADAVLTVFVPGCMGGKAAADILTGREAPAGKLPVTFPMRYQDTPAYPNFAKEYDNAYYGEGIFVGYRSYEKREIPVLFPFGFGLTYTTFAAETLGTEFVFDGEKEEFLEIPVRVRNTGARRGSEVIQVYSSEVKPRVLRPVKELAGYEKVSLEPGEERVITVRIRRESLQYYDPKRHDWVLPNGEHRLYLGTSSKDIFAEAELTVNGRNPYPLNGDSTIEEVLRDPKAMAVIDEFTGGMFSMVTEDQLKSMLYRKLSDILKMGMISVIPDTVKVDQMLQELYKKLEGENA